MNKPLINLKHISFYYEQKRPVLQNVSIELNKGEKLALSGSNGAGKSTLLRIIVGLLHPQSGEIEAFGKIRKKESDFWEVRARAGLVFQDAEDQLFSPTVFEDVAFGPLNLGKSHDETKKIVKETLEIIGLHGYDDRITYRLSGGEKRLVSLATVLAMKPDVLLLDEPSTGLDNSANEHLINTLNNLDVSMLIVSQDSTFLSNTTNKAIELKNHTVTPHCSQNSDILISV